MSELPYYRIPDAPSAFTAGAVLGRLADGIGFRYRWATDGLGDADLAFKPAPDCLSFGELLAHIHGLLRRVAEAAGTPPTADFMRPGEGYADTRERTLLLVQEMGTRFKEAGEADLARWEVRTTQGETLPFWYAVNGPLADSLTHIGQINSWRRMAGKPVPKASLFKGLPPPQ
jgi:hypothetical protein